MRLLYNFGIQLLGLSIRVIGLVNPKAKAWWQGRKNWRSNLPEIDRSKELIWFHCASLGEFDQGLPLMHAFRKNNPESILLLTFFSPSGMKHYHKRSHPADIVMYLPLDTPANARLFVKHFSPKIACFIKYEFWLNHILALKATNTKIYNISGNFRRDQRFFKWYGGIFRSMLTQFDYFFVQNENSVALLNSLGITNVIASGDTRYDKVLDTKNANILNPIIADFTKGSETFIAGSCWPVDEELFLEFVNSSSLKIILAPHNIDEKHIRALSEKLTRSFARYSTLRESEPINAEVLILDTIGHLSAAYRYATFAYIGGGFTGKLHNILEPAAFGLPVIFGPKYERFPEASEFVSNGFGFTVQDSAEFKNAVSSIRTNYVQLHNQITAYIEAHSGVSQKIYATITSN